MANTFLLLQQCCSPCIIQLVSPADFPYVWFMSFFCLSGSFLPSSFCFFFKFLLVFTVQEQVPGFWHLSWGFRCIHIPWHGMWMQTAVCTMYNFPADESEPQRRLTGYPLGRADCGVIHCKSVAIRRREKHQPLRLCPFRVSQLACFSVKNSHPAACIHITASAPSFTFLLFVLQQHQRKTWRCLVGCRSSAERRFEFVCW